MWILDFVALYLNPRVNLLFLLGFRVFIRFVIFLRVVHFDSRRDSSITGRTKRVSVRDNGLRWSALTPLEHPENAFKRQAYDLSSYPKDSLLNLPRHKHTNTHTKHRQTGEWEAAGAVRSAEILPAPSGTNTLSCMRVTAVHVHTLTHWDSLILVLSI